MSDMGMYLAEFFGTMILILLGDGVVASVSLKNSKAEGGGWIVVATGWGLAVAMGAYVTGWVSGAHMNPAVTIANAFVGNISWSLVPGYIIAQMLGAIAGGILVYLAFKDHFRATEDAGAKLGVFCTGPAIRNLKWNFITEVIGTAMLVAGLLGISHSNNGVGPLGALLAGFLVWSIGLSLGGPTGYAINPARDLGPRIAHAILPIPGKRDSDWGYSMIPVIGPVVGGVIGAFVYQFMLSVWV